MPEPRADRLGVGELTVRRVISDALGMLRQSFVRIAGVALVFFALPALLAIVAESLIGSAGDGQSGLITISAGAALLVAGALRILGPVAFAGFLDRAVAQEYLHGDHIHLRTVLVELPWRRLVAADVAVVFLTSVGLALLIVPGLVVYGLLGLIGPVIVQEQAGIGESFRRTISLALSAPRLVIVLVVVPFAFEEAIHALIYETLHSSGIGAQMIAEWIIAIVLGGTLGLLEVALATELMARNPLQATDSDGSDKRRLSIQPKSG